MFIEIIINKLVGLAFESYFCTPFKEDIFKKTLYRGVESRKRSGVALRGS